MARTIYISGEYAEKNPTWHVEHSAWKAQHILHLLQRNHLQPRTVCEVGSGAGEILKQLHDQMDDEVQFVGYDISPQAHRFSLTRATPRLNFRLMDFLDDADAAFDLILLIDLIEHLEDYYSYLRRIKSRGQYKVFHIPLQMTVQAVLQSASFNIARASVGHIHYFTKDIVLQVLAELDYRVLDYFYTAGSIDLPPTTLKMRLARPVRKLFFKLHRDLAVRLLAGFSILILAE